MKNKYLFYFLSFTWGLPLTLAGIIAALVLSVCGVKSRRWKWCRYYEVGEDWGGLNLGPVFIVDRASSPYIRDPEFGHAVQNCVLGPFMIFVVSIPSVIRWWWFRRYERFGQKPPRGYYDIWFERSASEVGSRSGGGLNA